MVKTIEEKTLTTIDNPFNPFTEYHLWERYDIDHRYYTTNVLQRIACCSPELTTLENIREVNAAVETILRLDCFGIYKSVSRQVPESEYLDEIAI